MAESGNEPRKGRDELTIQSIEDKEGVEAEEHAEVKTLALTLRRTRYGINAGNMRGCETCLCGARGRA